jgi:hypothetical protein
VPRDDVSSDKIHPTEDAMAFRLQDFCKTTRRSTDGGLPRLFPRLLGDGRLDPRLGIAIRYFETHLGRPRQAFDTEALMALFGNPRLVRGLIHCLTQAYRYRAKPLADVLGAERAAILNARGLAAPSDLRALAYARANQDGGFVRPEARFDFLNDLIDELGPTDLERALWLDAADQAVLVRHGPPPTAVTLRACYNVQALETLLSTAPESHFALCGDRRLVTAVAARRGVHARVKAATVSLYGQTDAVGSWTRHGIRVARTALTLLGAGALGPGTVIVQLGAQRYEVRLDASLLRKALPPRCWSTPKAAWQAVDATMRVVQALRRQGRLAGWRLHWWSEPLVAEPGLIWPELTLQRGATSVSLLPLPAAQLATDAVALAELAERLSFIVLAYPAVPPDLPAALTVMPGAEARLATLLPAYLERQEAAHGHNSLPEWLVVLMDAGRATGALSESELARRLDCAEEEVSARLAPATATASDLVYIDGFGLCTLPWLARARTLIDEETVDNGGRLELARLGRRLRDLAGHNEGLHALIAHLSGELQPVA